MDDINKHRKKPKRKVPITPQHAAAEAHVAAMKRDFSAAERRRLASEGKALPDGSYPIENVEDLHNAAHLASTGHGDVAAARRLVRRRAKELNVPNPLSSKKNMAPESAAVPSGNGNPLRGAVDPDARVSPPITEGHAAYSTGDHGSGLPRGGRDLAYGFPGETGPVDRSNPIVNMLTQRAGATSSYPASAGVMNAEYPQNAVVSQMPASDTGWSAGSYAGMNPLNTTYARQPEGMARDSATPQNGSHTLGDGVSSNALAQKATTRAEALEIMKQAMWMGRDGG
jgi:hypothetical protein